MNELQAFSNPDFGTVRALTIDGEPWAVGKDIAGALGYANPQLAIRSHVDDEDRGVSEMLTPKGPQQLVIINESGLYSLILTSKLPTAKKFKHWITSEVLPALRKTGKYEMGQANAVTPELMPSDYIRAANILASCKTGRLRSVVTLLERSGLDMSGVMIAGADGTIEIPTDEDLSRDDEIREFVEKPVPRNWQQWSIDSRRNYWRGDIPSEDLELVPRDRISAIEVWCELYNGDPRNIGRRVKKINASLRRILPLWDKKSIRVGAAYGVVQGFSVR